MTLSNLWAPWRLEYIKTQKDLACPFCELTKTPPSKETLVLFSDEDIFVVMNKFPYNPGHLMVIPRCHECNPSTLSVEVWTKLAAAQQECLRILKHHMNPQGFNLGMNVGAAAGAGLGDHLHWHIVPRWAGDTNFMPIIAETKAIPAHNLTVYEQLKDSFKDFSQKL